MTYEVMMDVNSKFEIGQTERRKRT